MANTKSADKAARKAEVRRVRNMHYKQTMRTKVKRVREALATGNFEDAQKVLNDAVRCIDITASRGVIPRKTASRKISRLSKAVCGMRVSDT